MQKARSHQTTSGLVIERRHAPTKIITLSSTKNDDNRKKQRSRSREKESDYSKRNREETYRNSRNTRDIDDYKETHKHEKPKHHSNKLRGYSDRSPQRSNQHRNESRYERAKLSDTSRDDRRNRETTRANYKSEEDPDIEDTITRIKNAYTRPTSHAVNNKKAQPIEIISSDTEPQDEEEEEYENQDELDYVEEQDEENDQENEEEDYDEVFDEIEEADYEEGEPDEDDPDYEKDDENDFTGEQDENMHNSKKGGSDSIFSRIQPKKGNERVIHLSRSEKNDHSKDQHKGEENGKSRDRDSRGKERESKTRREEEKPRLVQDKSHPKFRIQKKNDLDTFTKKSGNLTLVTNKGRRIELRKEKAEAKKVDLREILNKGSEEGNDSYSSNRYNRGY